jgi:hypothetical protein
VIVPVECLVVECDLCGQPLDDLADDTDAGTLIHFASELEVVAHLGGAHEGRYYAGNGRSGGVLLPGGVFFCYACKVEPHVHVPGEMIDRVCARCGQLADTHPETVDPPGSPLDRLLPGRPRHRRGLTPRQGSCDHDCRHGHQYPDAGIPEPPDGSRLEFVFATDRYAAWCDVESSLLAGWPAVMCWTLYPDSISHTWRCMQRTFGPALDGAILLAPAGVLRPAAHG